MAKRRSCRSTECSYSRPFSLSPFFHAFHVLLLFFSCLFFGLTLSCPHISYHPPPLIISTSSALSNMPLIPSSVAQSLDKLQTALLCQHSITRHGLRFPRCTNFLFTLLLILSGDINLNPGPTYTSSAVDFGLLNIRSASSITDHLNKPALLQEFISDYSIDILALTETWLPPDAPPSVLNSITPPNYTLIHAPRPQGRGGGVAILYRSFLKITRIPIPTFTSFEALCVKLCSASSSFIILTIYRPPSLASDAHNVFLSEFTSLLQDIVTSPSELIISGDFNYHVELPNSSPSSSFLALLDTFGLTQHVAFPTHIANGTLDLLITRSSSNCFSEIKHTDPMLSDHFAILTSFSYPKSSRPPRITKQIRNFKLIDTSILSNDIFSSCLYSSPAQTLSSYSLQLSSTLSDLLDKHAPLKTISCPSRERKPFISDEILAEKTKRSNLETKFRKNKESVNRQFHETNFKEQARKVSKLITVARRSYFRTLISTCTKQPRKLWTTLDSLLSRKSPACLPSSNSPACLASSFLNFFGDKISKLCSSFTPSSASSLSPHSPPPSSPPSFSTFAPATVDEVTTAILSSSNASCSLDFIPTFLLKSCLNALIQPITTLINLSLTEGIFPDNLKHAIVTPLHKKHSLPQEDLGSYRPISNLNFISKILERIIHSRLTNHLQSFPSLSKFQSAYRKFYSTETALTRIYNDLLLSINKQKISALVLLDLSAAFDTIDHSILLTRLESNFGITGTALSLLTSYLQNRSQAVLIGKDCSPACPLLTGVPQGSVLGPLLFCLYTTPLSYIFSNSDVSYHLYADDTQLYISFSSSDSVNSLSILSSTLDSVHSWFSSNRLSVNPSKTEFLLIGTPQQRSKLTTFSVSFHGNNLKPSESCRNLGVVFDSDLSFKSHISNICRTSFYHIRQLRQVRSSLDTNSAIVLANALVSAKLDYCNSLFYDLPDVSLNRLQLVQNALARVVVPSVKRSDHISPTLRKLHWLPIRQRITFKIASLTFKTLHFNQPSYLADLLIPHDSHRTLRSSDKLLLHVPLIKSSQGRRSFSYAAPFIWNNLSHELRSSPSIASFHARLKTHLFPP
jgi:Reverse transcriptase (RNA-dependent DNA polymerase)/Endonuclease-reverse transcriptase